MRPPSSDTRRNRVYKSLNRPLTYMGIDRTLFLLVGVATAASFNLFDSLPAAILVFVAGTAFGYWATGTDPAYLQIILGAGKYKARYDASKRNAPRVRIL